MIESASELYRNLMIFELITIICAGLFCGAAIYVSAVEHPARLSCGTEVALREFRPSYHRGAMMQGSLAVVGCICGIIAWFQDGASSNLIAGILLGSAVVFTLVVILPTNKQLQQPDMDSDLQRAQILLQRWGRLHFVRTLLSIFAFLILLIPFLI